MLILSEWFFTKNWTTYELESCVMFEVSGSQKLLPIWHGVSHDRMREFSPFLASKLSRSTEITSIEEIAAEIASVVVGVD